MNNTSINMAEKLFNSVNYSDENNSLTNTSPYSFSALFFLYHLLFYTLYSSLRVKFV